jgi:hypothetical protein
MERFSRADLEGGQRHADLAGASLLRSAVDPVLATDG